LEKNHSFSVISREQKKMKAVKWNIVEEIKEKNSS
jgi:hypothetical protein